MPLNAILRLARTGIRIMPTNWHRTPPPNRKTSVGTREEVESVPSGTGFPGVGRKIALGTSRMALTKGGAYCNFLQWLLCKVTFQTVPKSTGCVQ